MTQRNPNVATWYGASRRVRIGMILGSTAILAGVVAIRYYWGADSASAEPTRVAANGRASASTAARPQTAPSPPTPPPVVAIVNGEKITREDLARECLRHYGSDVLESVINRRLIAQECKRRSVEVTRAEVDAEIGRMAQRFGLPASQWYQMLQQERGIDPAQYANDIVWPTLALRKLAGERLEVSDEELRTAYETQFGPAVRARLISCADAKKASELHAKALADPSKFGDLAKDFSEDTVSASDKGWIPPVRKHAGLPEIERAAFSLADGAISPVIKVADDQYLILKREGELLARDVPFEEAAPKLRQMIEERKLRAVSHEVFRDLQKSAKVENYFNDPAKRDTGIAAALNGQQVTVRQLAEECITRHGADVLDGVINRRLIEQACAQRKITVTNEDLQQEIRRAAEQSVPPRADGSPDVEAWIKLATEEQGISKEVYVRDSVWPSVALKKLVGDDVEVTQEDLDKSFAANYGPRARCLAIVLDDLRRAQKVWAMARQDPSTENFGTLAEQYSIEPSSQKLRGQVPPIKRYGGQPTLEEEAFSLKPGELSGIVQVDDKYVILLCEGHTTPIDVDRKEVEPIIREDVFEKKLRIAMGQYFQKLQDHATIDNLLAGTTQSPRPAAESSPSTRTARLREVSARR
ncbi:MAG: peptidylprolyl isomerase [Pirellulales bacterium]|nr:peptidylprolyl isomerase [Pirellulales bacterium]